MGHFFNASEAQAQRRPQGWRAAALLVLLAMCWGGARGLMAAHETKHLYRKQVETLEQEWRTAQLSGDTATLSRMMSDDYIGIMPDGTVQTKEETLEHVRTRAMAVKRLDLSEVKAAIHGDTAVVTCKAEVDYTFDGVDTSGTFRYTRVYLRRMGVWSIINFEATRISPHGGRHNGEPPTAPPQ